MKTFKIYAKHSDLFSLTIAEDGKDLKEIDGYSPGDENISICSSSDDLDFEIDIETGKEIQNQAKSITISLAVHEMPTVSIEYHTDEIELDIEAEEFNVNKEYGE